ncbi:MAG: M28 family peptidase [Candidatus Omnitrophica bacterium]|nr:M28 family peptidase [Candidatus Omnitrophota bacterium]
MEEALSIDNLRRHIHTISYQIGERNLYKYLNLESTANYIREEFLKLGYSTKEQIFLWQNITCRNIVAEKEGLNLKGKIIIVGAHYDSVFGSPGADDNASGIAVLLELARLLFNIQLNKTVRFVAFTNEEPPFFMSKGMGSLNYTESLKKEKQDIEMMLCLESVGYYTDEPCSQSYPFGLNFFYPHRGNFIAMVSNLKSKTYLKKVVDVFKNNSNLEVEFLAVPAGFVPEISFSDNWSFWRYGYKALMLTDTAFYRYPYYHTDKDREENLDFKRMFELLKGLYYVMVDLAK